MRLQKDRALGPSILTFLPAREGTWVRTGGYHQDLALVEVEVSPSGQTQRPGPQIPGRAHSPDATGWGEVEKVVVTELWLPSTRPKPSSPPPPVPCSWAVVLVTSLRHPESLESPGNLHLGHVPSYIQITPKEHLWAQDPW